MKNNHSNKNSSEFRPTWYLALLVWPAVIALLFIVAGTGNDPSSNLAQGQPSAATPARTGADTFVATMAQLARPEPAAVQLSRATHDSDLPGASIAAYGN